MHSHTTRTVCESVCVGVWAHRHACVHERCRARAAAAAGAAAASAISRKGRKGIRGKEEEVWGKEGGGDALEWVRRYLSLQRGFGNVEKDEERGWDDRKTSCEQNKEAVVEESSLVLMGQVLIWRYSQKHCWDLSFQHYSLSLTLVQGQSGGTNKTHSLDLCLFSILPLTVTFYSKQKVVVFPQTAGDEMLVWNHDCFWIFGNMLDLYLAAVILCCQKNNWEYCCNTNRSVKFTLLWGPTATFPLGMSISSNNIISNKEKLSKTRP